MATGTRKRWNHDDFRLEECRQDSEENFTTEDEEQNEETLLLSGNVPNYASTINREQRHVRLTWENLNVTAPAKRSLFKRKSGQPEKQILRNVDGSVKSGQLVAIMGASGSGKTTLLNVLNARNMKGFSVNGSVCVNGQEIGRSITSISAYVQQDDLFLGSLTVREHLVFQALLRLPKAMSRAQKEARVDTVISSLGLKNCADTRIGTPSVLKGISGGEAKRLAFASEVLRNPQILFCDEPTTGIDSYMAQSVVKVLQDLAKAGKAVLCTIHQPTSDVYKMFDSVMFLAEGRVAYAGTAEKALEFFATQDFHCPDDYNPADFLIHTLAVVPGREAECKEQLEKICDKFQKSEFSLQNRDNGEDESLFQALDISQQTLYNANWPYQFGILLWRSLLFHFRNRNYVLTKVIEKVILGLFLGLLYLDNTLNQTTIMNYNGALFFILAEMTFPATFGLLNVLPEEFPLLVREHHNGSYKVSSYYLAKAISFIPTFSIDAILFIGVSYFMIGLRPTADAFFVALGLSILMPQCSCAFGALMAAVLPPSTALAVALMTPLETLMFIMAGYFANIGSISSYIAWFQYLSWYHYGYESFAINQWHPINNITCDPAATACIKTGDEVLAQLGFSPNNLDKDVLYIFALIAGFHTVGYLALWFRTYRAR